MADESGSTSTAPGRRGRSLDAIALRSISDVFGRISVEYERAEEIIDSLEGAERRLYKKRLAEEGREAARLTLIHCDELEESLNGEPVAPKEGNRDQ